MISVQITRNKIEVGASVDVERFVSLDARCQCTPQLCGRHQENHGEREAFVVDAVIQIDGGHVIETCIGCAGAIVAKVMYKMRATGG